MYAIYLLSFSIIILRSIHIVYVDSSFLFTAELHSIVRIHHNLCIPSPGDGDFGCFQFMAIPEKDFCVLGGDRMLAFLLGRYLGVGLLHHTCITS